MSAFTGEVHPVAAMFPMLADDELDELAADIEANGLLFPIVLDADGVLIDGRNRLEACRRAKVEPAFTALDGHDPVAYILATNIARRHLSKGQRAMAVARARLLNKHSLRGAAAVAGVNDGYVGKASVVLSHAPDLAESVMSGAVALNDAYDDARQRKAESESREQQAKRAQAELERLRIDAPDLADLVVEERMKLGEALAASKERREQEEASNERATADFAQSTALLWGLLNDNPTSLAERWRPDHNPHRLLKHLAPLWTAKGLRKLADDLTALAAHLDETSKGKL